jgi:hypothetical protein
MYYLYTTKQSNIMTTDSNIKSKKVTFGDNQVKGWLKLKDGTKTFFNIDNNGEWEQWGNSRDNLCLTVPFMLQISEFLISND